MAAIAVKLGLEVTVVEAADRVMHRVVDATVSGFYERALTEAGVHVLTSRLVARLEGDSQVSAVICEDGTRLPADIVVIGVGIVPNTELAARGGLAVDDGIVVDESTRTSDPNICAVGDCTNFPSALYQRRLRLECVQNANDQSRAAALTLTGQPAAYDPVPWFWSEQYDLKLQIAGLSSGYDTTAVRGNPTSSRSFALFYLREQTVIAVDAVNRPQDYIVGRKLVEMKAQPAPEMLRDETVDLKDFVS